MCHFSISFSHFLLLSLFLSLDSCAIRSGTQILRFIVKNCVHKTSSVRPHLELNMNEREHKITISVCQLFLFAMNRMCICFSCCPHFPNKLSECETMRRAHQMAKKNKSRKVSRMHEEIPNVQI